MSDHGILVFLLALATAWSTAAFVAALFVVRVGRGLWPGLRRLLRSLGVFEALTWLLIASVGVLMFGCQAPGDSSIETVTEAWRAISADGKITPEEAAWFAKVLSDSLGQASSIDWPTTIGGVLMSAVSSFLGVNVYRNARERKVWGPPPPPPSSSEAPA